MEGFSGHVLSAVSDYVRTEPIRGSGHLGARPLSLTRESSPVRTPIGTSPQWAAVLKRASQVATTQTTTCLHGESGTGKEAIARFIHRSSSQRGGPFLAI